MGTVSVTGLRTPLPFQKGVRAAHRSSPQCLREYPSAMLLIAPLAVCVAVDGDTLRCGSERVRLLGIDAPEIEPFLPLLYQFRYK
jgi:endonuclease YncB( thermonuclease family)